MKHTALTIPTGPQRGTWRRMKATGYGPCGTLSGWVKLGKRGQPLTRSGPDVYMNLNPAQVAQLESLQHANP